MTFYETDTLQGVLERRFPVSFSQEIADQAQALAERDIQYLDIKELNDLAAEYRNRLRSLIADYRIVRSGTAPAMARRVYASHESIFIRRQITDLWKVYRIIVADSHEMTADYLAQLSAKNYRASLPTEKGYRAAA